MQMPGPGVTEVSRFKLKASMKGLIGNHGSSSYDKNNLYNNNMIIYTKLAGIGPKDKQDRRS
jgi:hypothetical protein